jgi:hypothetical protein
MAGGDKRLSCCTMPTSSITCQSGKPCKHAVQDEQSAK